MIPVAANQLNQNDLAALLHVGCVWELIIYYQTDAVTSCLVKAPEGVNELDIARNLLRRCEPVAAEHGLGEPLYGELRKSTDAI